MPVAAQEAAAEATTDPTLDAEFDFASKLIQFELPDYAEFVVDRIVRTHPDQRDRASVVRAEAAVAARRFGIAEESRRRARGDESGYRACLQSRLPGSCAQFERRLPCDAGHRT